MLAGWRWTGAELARGGETSTGRRQKSAELDRGGKTSSSSRIDADAHVAHVS
jgi:hypothetical protein